MVRSRLQRRQVIPICRCAWTACSTEARAAGNGHGLQFTSPNIGVSFAPSLGASAKMFLLSVLGSGAGMSPGSLATAKSPSRYLWCRHNRKKAAGLSPVISDPVGAQLIQLRQEVVPVRA